MSAPFVIGVDVGGTKIRSGVLDRAGGVHERYEVESPGSSEEDVLRALDGAVEAVLGEPIGAIGFGVPANLDRRTGRVLRSTNLEFDDFDLAAHARERFGLPVGVENDANAATLAEWKLGAGRGLSDLVLLTLGTGVGGGIVLDDRIYRGWAEVGHMVVLADGPPCQGNCHGRGHVEALCSGTAADRAAQKLWGPDADAHALVERARNGDDAARACLAEIGRYLGAAIGSLANLFDPEVVLIGGGFGEAAGDLVLGPAQDAARREALAPADTTLRVAPAELGAEAGLVGAALVGFGVLDGAW
ncbi:MAG: ROK family protein [Actinobacteria bacterium]|nr:ROK family protein [Actinomycetota bacterium]